MILKIALKQARFVACITYNANSDKQHRIRRKQECRVAKTPTIVFGAFLVYWLSTTITTITSNWYPECFLNFRMNNRSLFTFVFALIVEALPVLNSSINYFIYTHFNKQFLQVCSRLFHNLFMDKLKDKVNLSRISDSTRHQQSRSNNVTDICDTVELLGWIKAGNRFPRCYLQINGTSD